MNFQAVIFDQNLRIVGFWQGSERQLIDSLKPGHEYVSFDSSLNSAPAQCLYIKRTNSGWQFDPDRKPQQPEPTAVWEHPRWVLLPEQRARYNAALQAQMDALERAALRPAREEKLAMSRPSAYDNPVKTARDAVERLAQIEDQIQTLRNQWWHADMAAPPVPPQPEGATQNA